VIAFLARHEWRVLTASAVVQWVIVIFAIALIAASTLGAVRAAREQRTFAAFAARTSQQLAQASSVRAAVAANDRGWLALVPPAPLGALAVGQSDVYPGFLKVTARNLDAVVTGDQIEHPLAVASGHFDAAFVVLFLYPLLIFAVSFDLTATERDRGTLRMVLAQPVKLGDVVAGKMIARAVMLALPVILIPIVVTFATGDASATASHLRQGFGAQEAVALQTSLTVWTITVLAYGSIWHGMALLVNSRGWNAAANALVLTGIWLIFAIVGPASINLLIAIRYPMPSRVEAAVQARAATQDATVQGSRQLGQFLQDHPTSANVGQEGMRQFAMLQAARDQQIADRLQAVEATFDAQLQRQQRLASWLSVLSPTMVAQGVLLEAAGTSASRFDHFRAEARAFQRQWQAYFEPRVLDAATLSREELAAAPTFRYADEPGEATIRRTALPIIAMAAAGAVLLLVGMRSYRGYAV
jgi:ABC-2 type transport system permease protein